MTGATKQPVQRGRATSCPLPVGMLSSGRETSWAPKPGDSRGVRSSSRENPAQRGLASLATVPSGCPLPCRRAPAVMPARCGCCPGRGPRRSPRGGSCGSAPVSAHPAPPDPAHLRGDTHSISGTHPKPPGLQHPKPRGMRAPRWSQELLVGVPWGGSIPFPGGPGTARGVRARHGGAEGAFPIPAPKVAAASGLNGFDYLIRLCFYSF